MQHHVGRGARVGNPGSWQRPVNSPTPSLDAGADRPSNRGENEFPGKVGKVVTRCLPALAAGRHCSGVRRSDGRGPWPRAQRKRSDKLFDHGRKGFVIALIREPVKHLSDQSRKAFHARTRRKNEQLIWAGPYQVVASPRSRGKRILSMGFPY